MFDFGIGSFELMMLAVVAIIVVGPKDLPKLLRTVGQFTTKVRAMAREFQGYLDEAARESGLDEVKNEVSKVTDFDVNNPLDSVKSAIEESAPKSDDERIAEGNKAAESAAAAETDTAAEKPEAKSTPAKKPAKKAAVRAAKKPAKKATTTAAKKPAKKPAKAKA